MFYVEFIHWDRDVPIEIFRHLGRQSSAWKEGSPDRLVLQLGRTLRLGPEPGYLAFWEIPNIDRLDEWEVYFKSAEAIANRRSQAMHKAIKIERAGVYDCLFAHNNKPYPLYYIEYYDAYAPEVIEPLSRDDLLYALRRVGRLGPEAEMLLIWGCDSYRDVEALSARIRPNLPAPRDAGVYKDFGEETL